MNLINLPEEEETKLINQVNNGDFDEQSVQDLEDNFDIPLAEAIIKNYIVYNDKEDIDKLSDAIKNCQKVFQG